MRQPSPPSATPRTGFANRVKLARWPRLRSLIQLLRGRGSRKQSAWSVGVGLFIGCLPLYGLHFPLCVAVCVPFGLDALIAYLAANVSNPLLLPLILLAEVEIGSWLLHGQSAEFTLDAARRLGALGFGTEVALGSVVFGAALALLGALLTARFVRDRPPTPLELALRRTQALYTGAPAADRHYVRFKMALDPVIAQVAELAARHGPAGWGRVLDAGCGRGQLGLLLLELGAAADLTGFDFDTRKVEVARGALAHASANGGRARFYVGDIAQAELAGFDTILLIDVLHYLSRDEQDRLLTRVARALPVGGRLLLRETDSRRSASSLLSKSFEYLATRVGYNRSAHRLAFRSLPELTRYIENLGLKCAQIGAEHGVAEQAGEHGVAEGRFTEGQGTLSNELLLVEKTR
ncbi:MAG TPA: DUF2062 domain-containing protein, partial [Polyangiaceae bacterium]|nr:DUF2062 domain-containing protein [Polyangiaceae bacterium]